MSWKPEGNIKGPIGNPGPPGTGTVSSVFGRQGAVVSAVGDYNYNQLVGGVAHVSTIYLDLQTNIDAASPNPKARLVGTATGCQLEYNDTTAAAWKVAQTCP